MTTYLITEAQRDLLFANHLLLKHETDLLKSLPMVDSKPVAYHYKYSPTDMVRNVWAVGYVVPSSATECRPLYTSPQALTKISAADVTDEMVTTALKLNNSGASPYGARDAIVAAVNAYLITKHRSEA